ncbi:GyrI-like domain-containing protein [Nocardioides zeae]|uniref:GyrI-like small molecule binding domain-containing protein n=1 Tax=Nocardioides zeae TaxID=1457234 RepID=A0AAJ1TXN0_9ACTN|nr:GyrI-like domain-containing protein [Nocardioides zeae]MDQ1104215.1 hypothetical protein [Nocardioides zeae]
MDNHDLKKDPRLPYRATTRIEVVDVPAIAFLAAVGEGDPNTSRLYADVVEALYASSYGVRAVAMAELGRKHTVAPLEGLWWADDLRVFSARDKDAWHWQMMMAQPAWVTDDLVTAGIERARSRRDLAEGDRVTFTTVTEGLAVQTLHVGPYDAEGPTIAQMHDEFMPQHGYRPRGAHHEIYLSDARKTAPERLRTILRQPIEPIEPTTQTEQPGPQS